MTIEVGAGFESARRDLVVGDETYTYYPVAAAGDVGRLPACLAIVLENLLRCADDGDDVKVDVAAFTEWLDNGGKVRREIDYRPARVLMQDFTGVPAVVDLAAMRDAMTALGGNPERINPLAPVDLVIDHSVSVDAFGSRDAFARNVEREYERNDERYRFLKWGQQAFDNFRVVPPGTGICHQVNLEYLAQVVWTDTDQHGARLAYPDTLVGTDSHTTMVNGLGVLGWGVGGIEAEAAMLGQPVSMLLPEVAGFRLEGALREGVTATDLVLRVVELLREHGVVGKFVEFHGPGLAQLPLANRATIANMAPEYGATCGFFPVDGETLRYLEVSGREPERIALVEAYSKANGLWCGDDDWNPVYSSTLSLDLGTVEAAIAGPKRPQDRVLLTEAASAFDAAVKDYRPDGTATVEVAGEDYSLRDGSVVIAAITSCTNTSNPYVMLGAGLLARKARERGLRVPPWVKTSLAPGSQVVSGYLQETGVQDDLDALGFHLVGYGCTTCIGNSGPLPEAVAGAIEEGDLMAVSVLSGNRNFEGRINPDVRANYLASPPLVVAYALAGDMNIDLATEPLGTDSNGKPVMLSEIWPREAEIAELVENSIDREMFRERYADLFEGDDRWRALEVEASNTYAWPQGSTYVRKPPYFDGITEAPPGIDDIEDARVLAILGDTVTTDHISPAGTFQPGHPAGQYLAERQVAKRDFNSYGARRGNHEVMMRGTFANTRIRNEMLDDVEGGFTLGPDGEQQSIFDAAMAWAERDVPLVIIAGKEYGTGSSRDWAAKGPRLLGVRAVIAESYERIHRSNLVGMGVLPFEFTAGDTRTSLALTGEERLSFTGLAKSLSPGCEVEATLSTGEETRTLTLRCRIDTASELDYVRHGGVLHFVLRRLLEN